MHHGRENSADCEDERGVWSGSLRLRFSSCLGMKPGKKLPPLLPTWITQEMWRVCREVSLTGMSKWGRGDGNIQPLNAHTSAGPSTSHQRPSNRKPHEHSTVSKSLERKLELSGPGSRTGGFWKVTEPFSQQEGQTCLNYWAEWPSCHRQQVLEKTAKGEGPPSYSIVCIIYLLGFYDYPFFKNIYSTILFLSFLILLHVIHTFHFPLSLHFTA